MTVRLRRKTPTARRSLFPRQATRKNKKAMIVLTSVKDVKQKSKIVLSSLRQATAIRAVESQPYKVEILPSGFEELKD